ncbi:right-handed parallel beta-helix repeat-containing protein [Butyrivibrio sp. NC3005]|uniref:right-handed parallel beta-helix repeat-containing protein n=1 Tax=Butyrivibrio sp. NC3005 TaxID=1280685 RepID=UPI000427AB64|nr:right-handed parallel beta-helix repeat-containing protein [Butyrivibrio sp. NC3005]
MSTVSEFIDGLCSNNKLVLNKGFYDILEFSSDNKNVKKEEVFDGNELVLSNLSNITIVGDNYTLLVSPRYANVMNFCGCSNIKLIGLTIGHTPHKGSCTGAVLRFSDCNNIQVDSLELFGCGTYGIELENCSNVRVNGTRIYECTYGALNILHSSLEFTNSMIYDCNKTAGCLIEAIKRIISSCGKIEEMIFEDGNMTIVANLESYDSYMKVNSLIESYGNMDIICG